MSRLEFTRKTKEARRDLSGLLCEAVWETGRCNSPLVSGNIEYHHDVEAERGGDNSLENCRAVCVKCHKLFTAKFVMEKAKAERQRAQHLNSARPSDSPLAKKPKPSPIMTKPPLPRRPIYQERT
jgi:5-methylcytosine-specific restriction endonuclease McrA